VKLLYFGLEGRGELIRHLLNAANIDYEDARLSFEEWPKFKSGTPFGQLPVLTWDGEEVAQSMAITRFVARKVGLGGRSDLEFAQADMVVEHMMDIWPPLNALRFASSQEERKKKVEPFLKEFLPDWLGKMENILKNRGGGWFAGKGMTFADLSLMVLIDFLMAPQEAAFTDLNNLEERKKILDGFPLLKANYERTCLVPTVLSWKQKKPVSKL